jgi:hypothetical protein
MAIVAILAVFMLAFAAVKARAQGRMAYGTKRPYAFVSVADIPYSIFLRDTRSRLRRHHKDPCFADCSDHLHRRR